VLGVIVNFAASQKGDPVLLFTGVALIAIAIIINAVAYKRKQQSRSEAFFQRHYYFTGCRVC
jgi:glucose uptake protein